MCEVLFYSIMKSELHGTRAAGFNLPTFEHFLSLSEPQNCFYFFILFF